MRDLLKGSKGGSPEKTNVHNNSLPSTTLARTSSAATDVYTDNFLTANERILIFGDFGANSMLGLPNRIRAVIQGNKRDQTKVMEKYMVAHKAQPP